MRRSLATSDFISPFPTTLVTLEYMSKGPILRIAVPSPLRRCFDYLPPKRAEGELPRAGMRVRVPFGRRTVTGIVLEWAQDSDVPANRLKPVLEVLDREPALSPDLLRLLVWASRYYHHPVGEVVLGSLPRLLREGRPATLPVDTRWRLTESGEKILPEEMTRAPLQAGLLTILKGEENGLSAAAIGERLKNWQPAMKRLLEKGWVEQVQHPVSPPGTPLPKQESPPPLNPAQRRAVDSVTGAGDGFSVSLLDGVTGSGKTEVYLQIIERTVEAGRQALVLVPEIGLTPQLVKRFRRRFSRPIALIHSALSPSEQLTAWLSSRNGEAAIVIGTRSALFTPMKDPGIIVIDEEHDPSFKQQEGFRYSARDLAIVRARNAGIPIVLGSATPSLESLYHARRGAYRHLVLPERAGNARPPRFELVDMRRQPLQEGLSPRLLATIEEQLRTEGQILLFLNRRGYAPTLLCHECGWVGRCHRCDAHLTFHRRERRLRCHHCGAESPVEESCPACGSIDLLPLGMGTERIELLLRERFPQAGVARLDRDSTRRKGSMQQLLERVGKGEIRILIGTQMLTKGHHFPNVTLVGILDTDQGLFSTDFRAAERMSQLIVQVAGRAGRADKPGLVMIQTHHPEHPLLQQLMTRGYHRFAETALEERREAELPPYTFMALLRAEATAPEQAMEFLHQAREMATPLCPETVALLGPVAAPMERRAGRYRAQLLLQSAHRPALHRLLERWIPGLEKMKSARRVRWSLDVDPIDLF